MKCLSWPLRPLTFRAPEPPCKKSDYLEAAILGGSPALCRGYFQTLLVSSPSWVKPPRSHQPCWHFSIQFPRSWGTAAIQVFSWGAEHLEQKKSPSTCPVWILTHSICEQNSGCFMPLSFGHALCPKIYYEAKNWKQQMRTDRKQINDIKKIWSYIFFDCLRLIWRKLLSWGTQETGNTPLIIRISILSIAAAIENASVIWNLSSQKASGKKSHSCDDFQHGANIHVMPFKS